MRKRRRDVSRPGALSKESACLPRRRPRSDGEGHMKRLRRPACICLSVFALALFTGTEVAPMASAGASTGGSNSASIAAQTTGLSAKGVNLATNTGSAPTATATTVSSPFASDVDAMGSSSTYSNVYGGIWQGSTGVYHVDVATTSASASSLSAFEASVESEAQDAAARYTFTSVARTYAELAQLTTAIAGDTSMLNADGVRLVQWGPDVRSNTVQIYVLDYLPSVVSILDSLLGATQISISSKVISAPPIRASTRTSDSRPFYGGDRIWFGNNSLRCTGGFWYIGIHSGSTYMLTASHCDTKIGATVYTNTSVHYAIGQITARHFANGGYDIETVDGTGLGYVYGNGSTVFGVVGARNPSTSTDVTFDGATTGEKRGVPVIVKTQCITFGDGITTCHLFTGYDGTVVCQGGDSGGPVYQHLSTGGVEAMGIIIGVSATGLACYAQQIAQTLTLVTGTILTDT
jgi:hypothetical protein